jgi:hypothetical protein
MIIIAESRVKYGKILNFIFNYIFLLHIKITTVTMIKIKSNVALIAMMPILFIGCKSVDSNSSNALIGSWRIAYSEMNGAQNGFMSTGFMEFVDNKKVKTNIFGETSVFDYKYDGTELEVVGGAETFVMTANHITTDSIELTGKVRTFDMMFGLSRDRVGGVK